MGHVEVEIGVHGEHTVPKILEPLTGNVIGDNKRREQSPHYTRREEEVHVGVPDRGLVLGEVSIHVVKEDVLFALL